MYAEKSVRAIILSGGLGQRLHPLTDPRINPRAVPKGLLPLGNVPAIEYLVRKLVREGIKDISIATSFMGDKIKRFLKYGESFGADIDFKDDVGITQSGDMLAITNIAMEKVAQGFSGRFVVLSSDIVTDLKIEDALMFHFEKKIQRPDVKILTMVVNEVPISEVYRFGTVQIDVNGQVLKFWQKNPNSPSNLNNSSIYIFDSVIFSQLPVDVRAEISTIPPFFQWFISQNPEYSFYVFKHNGYWRDFGELGSYLQTQWDILDGKTDFIPRGVFIDKGFIADLKGARIVGPSLIGADCNFGKGTIISPYVVIGDNFSFGQNIQVSGSIFLGNADLWSDFRGVVSSGSIIENSIIVSKETNGDIKHELIIDNVSTTKLPVKPKAQSHIDL